MRIQRPSRAVALASLVAFACHGGGDPGSSSSGGDSDTSSTSSAIARPPLTPASNTLLTDATGALAPPGDGKLAVDDRGQVHTHIPIWAPPGRAGIQPELSLDYSSGGGNGVMGVGWALAGLPRITRCPSLRKNGNIAPPIEWNENDGLCLDGEPLWGDSDHWMYYPFHWNGSRIWHNRSSFSDPGSWEMRTKDGRIVTFGATADSRLMVNRFLVTPAAMTWAVSRVQDRAGNFMTVTYETSTGGDLRPTRIDYTGSAADPTTHRSVTFTYEPSPRPDTDMRVIAEQRFTYPDRLHSIEMHAPNSLGLDPLRKVSFAYTTSPTTGRSLLSSVTECDGSATPLCRAQTFSYAPGVPLGANGAYSSTPYDSNGAQIDDVAQIRVQPTVAPNARLLDVDGDGRDDLLYLSNDAAQSFHLRLSQGTAFGPAIATGIPASTMENLPTALTGPSAPLVLDFNGDGHADILVNQGETTPYYKPQVRLYLANNATGSWTLGGPGYQFQLFTSGNNPAPIYSDVQTADLNGDGRPDLVMSAGAAAYYVINTDGTVDGLSAAAQLPSQTMANYQDSLTNYFLDLNNDGVTDLMTRQWADNACQGHKTGDVTCDCSKIGYGVFDLQNWIYPSYNGTQPTTATRVGGLKYCKMVDLGDYPQYQHLFGDFNGDGVVDTIEVFAPTDTDGNPLPLQMQLLLGGGDQSFSKPSTSGGAFTVPAGTTFQTVDADGDGKADLLVRGWGNTPYSVYSWKNGAWQPPTPLAIGEPAVTYTEDQSVFQPGDVDGDGLTDFIALDGNGAIVLYTRNTGTARADLLTSTSGEFVPVTTVKYTPYHPSASEDRGDCSLPLACASRVGYLASEVDTDNGLPGTNVQTHAYASGRADALGWGFLGFKTHTVTDGPSNQVTTRRFDFTRNTAGPTPFYPFVGQAVEIDTTIGYRSGATNVTRTTTTKNQYEVRGLNATTIGPFMVHPTSTRMQTSDSNTSLLIDERWISRSFDDYGNQTYERDQLPLVGEERGTTTTYYNDFNTWIIGRPTYVTESSSTNVSILGGTTQARETAYTYDPLGQLAVQIDNPGAQNGSSYDPLPSQSDGVQTLYTRYTRDANGLPHVVEKLDNLTNPVYRRATQYDYDTIEGMFVVQTTDPANLVSQTAYEPGLGVLAAQADVAGILTTFQYDTFGRIRADHPAAGGGRTVVYHAGGTIDDHRSGQYLTTSTLDSLRRPVQTKTTGRADGKPVYVETVYDALGRKVSEARPHFAGATAEKTITTYDNLGRATKLQGADGSVQTMSYLGNVVTTTNPDGDTTTVTNDALGRPVSSVQTIAPGHTTTTTLAYGPFDTVIKTTDTLGNLVTSNYDRRGRLRWKNDLDSHVTAHYYNVFGEVSDEVRGARLQPVTFGGHVNWLVMGGTDTQIAYDGDGRVTSKTTPDMAQVFTYDTVMPGKLSNVTITGGPTIAYTYVTSGNGVGNVAAKTWAGPRGAIGYAYTYDAYNRLKTTTYPRLSNNGKSLVVRNTYSGGDIGGELTKVDDVTTSTAVNYWTLTATDASEQYPSATLRNNVTSTYGEDPAHPGWLNTVVAKQGTTTIQNLRYVREGSGRVRERDDLVNHIAENFYYDGVERLVDWSWSGNVGARSVEYVYDDIGNLTGRMVTAGPGTSVTYTIGAPPIGPHQVASDGTTTFQYDSEGNELAGAGRTFTWNSFGRPTSITATAGTYQLAYDADLARFSRTDPSNHTRYSYGKLFEEFSDAAGTHDVLTITANGKPVGEKEITNNAASTAKTNALLVDALGSLDTIVMSSGHRYAKYDPFGSRVTAGDPSTRITAAPGDLRIGFTGHAEDDDVDLIDMVGRVYDPMQQRFLSVDPPAPDPTDGQAYNPYSYVRNNPLNATDPTGYYEVLLDGWSLGNDGQDAYAVPPSATPIVVHTYYVTVLEGTFVIPYGTLPGEIQGANGDAGPGAKTATPDDAGVTEFDKSSLIADASGKVPAHAHTYKPKSTPVSSWYPCFSSLCQQVEGAVNFANNLSDAADDAVHRLGGYVLLGGGGAWKVVGGEGAIIAGYDPDEGFFISGIVAGGLEKKFGTLVPALAAEGAGGIGGGVEIPIWSSSHGWFGSPEAIGIADGSVGAVGGGLWKTGSEVGLYGYRSWGEHVHVFAGGGLSFTTEGMDYSYLWK